MAHALETAFPGRLSDSSRYLALDGAYHPIWVAFPSNPTLGSKVVMHRSHRMGLTPAVGGPDRGNSELRETKTNGCLRPMRHTSRSLLLATGFGVGLLPVHSLLLRESQLFFCFFSHRLAICLGSAGRIIRAEGGVLKIWWDSSTELEEAETDNDDVENERGPLNTVTEESRPILHRSSRRRRPPSPCHLCDCEIREECKREMDLPPEKTCWCVPGMQKRKWPR